MDRTERTGKDASDDYQPPALASTLRTTTRQQKRSQYKAQRAAVAEAIATSTSPTVHATASPTPLGYRHYYCYDVNHCCKAAGTDLQTGKLL